MDVFLNDPFFMVLSVALVAALAFNIWQTSQRSKAWKEIAADLALEPTKVMSDRRKDDALMGVYRHRKITLIEGAGNVIRKGKRRSDMMSNATTIVKTNLNLPAAYQLTLNRLASLGNSVDEGTGNAEIDQKFSVVSEPLELVQELVAKEAVCQALLKMKLGGAVYIQENELIYDQVSRVTDAGYLRDLFDLIVVLAGAIETSQVQIPEQTLESAN